MEKITNMKRDYIWAFNAIDNCHHAGYLAKNEAISYLWHKIADELHTKYIVGQVWLRTYDGKLK